MSTFFFSTQTNGMYDGTREGWSDGEKGGFTDGMDDIEIIRKYPITATLDYSIVDTPL